LRTKLGKWRIRSEYDSLVSITGLTMKNYTRNTPTDKGKGQAISLKAWTGSDGSRNLRLPDFKTIGT